MARPNKPWYWEARKEWYGTIRGTRNPRLQVASLGVSDSDFSQPLPFTKAVLDRAADSLDLFTGHP